MSPVWGLHFILQVVGNFQRILDKEVKWYEQQMYYFTTVEGWVKLWYFYRPKICVLIMFLDKCLSDGSLWIVGFQLICVFLWLYKMIALNFYFYNQVQKVD